MRLYFKRPLLGRTSWRPNRTGTRCVIVMNDVCRRPSYCSSMLLCSTQSQMCSHSFHTTMVRNGLGDAQIDALSNHISQSVVHYTMPQRTSRN